MSLEHELFQAILANPDDITPRLIYADWCDEQGDPRGEFIRIQCELSSMRGHRLRQSQLTDRAAELLEQNRRVWNGEIHRRLSHTPLKNQVDHRRGLVRRWEYQRGFVELVIVEPRAFLEYSEDVFQIGPIRRLRILKAARQLREILQAPAMVRLGILELQFRSGNREELEKSIFANRHPLADRVIVLPLFCRPREALR